MVRAKKGFHRDVMEELSQQGWARVRVNGDVKDLREVLKDPSENPLDLGRYEKHSGRRDRPAGAGPGGAAAARRVGGGGG